VQINHLDIEPDLWVARSLAPATDEANDAVRRVLIFRRLLRNEPRGRALDLGAGHCKFSLWAQRLGFEVTAVDARTARAPPPEQLGSIRLVHADVRDFDFSGFGLIFYLGLIYHFDIEDQISTLRRCVAARATVILDTQIHIPQLVPPGFDEGWARQVVQRDDYTGAEFPERDNLQAAVGNQTSFWHTESSWLRLFENVGFSEVTVVTPLLQTKYGGRGFYVLRSVNEADGR
jgi:SAM-dependent methyltransferase